MLTVATCFWRANRHTAKASVGYEPFWVDRLARGFRRNLTIEHRFVCFTDREYEFQEDIEQRRLSTDEPTWASMIEPFSIDGPLIVAGLDTVIVDNIDPLATWCLVGDRIALPRSPGKDFACNGIAFVPAGFTSVYETWRGENDMEWLRTFPHILIDKMHPGEVVSYKCDVRPNGLNGASVVYFHGQPKPDRLQTLDWVREHWI